MVFLWPISCSIGRMVVFCSMRENVASICQAKQLHCTLTSFNAVRSSFTRYVVSDRSYFCPADMVLHMAFIYLIYRYYVSYPCLSVSAHVADGLKLYPMPLLVPPPYS